MELTLHPEFLTLSKRRRYLIGVSGGRDSVALLHTLLSSGTKNLIVCHLNHGLRGRQSGMDASFVRRLAKKHNLPFEIEKTDVRAMAEKNNESIELAARNARHAFFKTCAKKHRCQRLLLAHHADDQVETILFNLLRGSAGLRGMRFRTTHHQTGKKLEIYRPLLETTRDQIDQYLTRHSIAFREDASNTEAFATRNRLRHEALPLLRKIMGREINPAILRAEAHSRTNSSIIETTLDQLSLLDPQNRIYLPKLQQLTPSLQTHALRTYLVQQGIPDINNELILRCQQLLNDPATAKVNLPGNKHLRRKQKRIFIQ